jgi:4-diphosphocytidyl-2-C-methyl-D-erythritol kinase
VGERLSPVEVPPRWYVVLTPPVEVSTAAVFAAPELTRDTEALKMEDFSAQSCTYASSASFRNDLEAVVTARYPEVRRHLEWLRQHGSARMTGSGSCVFAGFDSREGAQRVMSLLPESMSGFIAQGLRQHPLLEQ